MIARGVLALAALVLIHREMARRQIAALSLAIIYDGRIVEASPALSDGDGARAAVAARPRRCGLVADFDVVSD